jgi:hypothetical protein
MAKFAEKIEIEYEQNEDLLGEIPDKDKLPYLSFLELAGVATLLHNFYHGVENILKQCLLAQNTPIPDGASWHRDLLKKSAEINLISEETMLRLGEYLAFRHFFVHAYALDLYADKMESLVENIENVFSKLRTELEPFLEKNT